MVIRWLHDLADRLGIKPAVLDGFVAAVVLVVGNWAIAGEPFDVDAIKGAVFLLILGVVGVAAPPASGVSQDAVLAKQAELEEDTQRRKRRHP